MDDVSDGPSEVTSQSNDTSSATVTASGSSETSRRGRRNRRDRHKNAKSTVDAGVEPSELEPKTQSLPQSMLNPADSQSSGRNKSSLANGSSSVSNVIGRETTSRGGGADAVKLASLAVCPPPAASITGN